MNRVPAEPAGGQGLQQRGGRRPVRPVAEADAVAAKHLHSRGPFRYRLLDLAGTQVGLIERGHALRCDDVVVIPSQLGEATWRVLGVVGTCVTVTRLKR